ncbi:MAG: DNA-deoxyinosine glycosylase [Pseudomonadota bacterium]
MSLRDDLAQSFPPLARKDARVLILGSMPGRASLEAQRYYAFRHNQFWPIMADLLDFEVSLPYAQRGLALRRAGVAVWDVLKQCERPGSLDTAIVESSIVSNDFDAFFARHRQVRHVFFNGAKAEASYLRYVLKDTDAPWTAFERTRLPSTSPANAGTSLAAKTRAWGAVLGALNSR